MRTANVHGLADGFVGGLSGPDGDIAAPAAVPAGRLARTGGLDSA